MLYTEKQHLIAKYCKVNLTKVGEFVESEPLVIPLVDLRLNCAFCVVSCR